MSLIVLCHLSLDVDARDGQRTASLGDWSDFQKLQVAVVAVGSA